MEKTSKTSPRHFSQVRDLEAVTIPRAIRGRFCDPHCVKLLRVPLRTCLVVGTVATFVVGVVLVVLAYRGWTFGLGTHDKPTLVTVALTADALFFGFVAAVLALAAYWSAKWQGEAHHGVLVQLLGSQRACL
jgi:hypothetical protein